MTAEERAEFYKYCKKPTSALLIMGGSALIFEHLMTFGKFDLFDIFGHEFYGLLMIIAGILLSTDWSQWKEKKLWHFRNWFR